MYVWSHKGGRSSQTDETLKWAKFSGGIDRSVAFAALPLDFTAV